MLIDPEQIKDAYLRKRERGLPERHRVSPSIWQYDYPILRLLRADLEELLSHVPAGGQALDLGAGQSPYAQLLEARGFAVQTLDPDLSGSPLHHASGERSELPAGSFELVLCTQVLEHCRDPRAVLAEMRRLLKPGGHAIISVPHVWFYHPHPEDHWRFTPEGLAALCADSALSLRRMHCQGDSVACFLQIVAFLIYGAIGRFGAPLFALLSLLGRCAELLPANPLFCMNLCCLATREGD